MAGLSPYEDLPEAMVLYYASRLTKVSKHVNGRQGQKYRARARRRGTYGKVCRRRALARQRLALTSRVNIAVATRLGAAPDGFVYDENIPRSLERIWWQEPDGPGAWTVPGGRAG